MSHNYFGGSNARCRTCGHHWPATWQTAQTDDCVKCEKIFTDHPELAEWICNVIRTKLDDHESSSSH